MAQGGKVNFRQHYKPEPAIFGPYTRTEPSFVDLLMVWVSGFAIGFVLALLVTGN
jgi:hypothetical protein